MICLTLTLFKGKCTTLTLAGGDGHLVPCRHNAKLKLTHESVPSIRCSILATAVPQSQYWQFSASTKTILEINVGLSMAFAWSPMGNSAARLSTVFLSSRATVIQLELSRGRLSIVPQRVTFSQTFIKFEKDFSCVLY